MSFFSMDFGAGDLKASVSQTKTNTVLRYYCKNNGNIMKCPSCATISLWTTFHVSVLVSTMLYHVFLRLQKINLLPDTDWQFYINITQMPSTKCICFPLILLFNASSVWRGLVVCLQMSDKCKSYCTNSREANNPIRPFMLIHIKQSTTSKIGLAVLA